MNNEGVQSFVPSPETNAILPGKHFSSVRRWLGAQLPTNLTDTPEKLAQVLAHVYRYRIVAGENDAKKVDTKRLFVEEDGPVPVAKKRKTEEATLS